MDGIQALREKLAAVETVVIGAGAGLSVSAGYTYTGERFQTHFGDFAEKYHFRDMYSGGFYPYGTPEEYWAFWSRYILINRYEKATRPVYDNLLELVKGKDYFVLTTNVDHCFQRAGFDKSRLFYTQGDYGLFQCSRPCCPRTYDNEEIVRQMAARQKNMRIPGELVPLCPVCQRPMTMNLRIDSTFVEDEGWHQASRRYTEFLVRHEKLPILFLELGVGMNTPGIIKFPFWRMTRTMPQAVYGCVNLEEPYVPEEIEDRSICMGGDIGDVVKELLR